MFATFGLAAGTLNHATMSLRRSCLFFIAPFLFTAHTLCAAGSGTLYTFGVVHGQIAIYAVDPATGALSHVVTTDAVGLNGPASAIDPMGGRIFFRSGYGELYTVDIRARTFLHVPTSGTELQFDPSAQRLYTFDGLNGHIALYELNPMTGATTLVVETDAIGLNGPLSALDEETGRLFFRSSTELYTINTRQRTFTHTPAPGYELQFDSTTRHLYTLDTTGGRMALYTLDPDTGATALVAATDAIGVNGPASALDEQLGRFFFYSQGELYVINIPQQTVAHVPVSAVELVFAPTIAAIPVVSAGMLLSLLIVLGGVAMWRLQ